MTYVDFSASYKFTESVEAFGGIDNAFDEQPPLLTSSWGGDANTDVTLYDVMGAVTSSVRGHDSDTDRGPAE